ncbi:MAG: hypothetical protein ACJ72P_02350 [Nocardioides sp.]
MYPTLDVQTTLTFAGLHRDDVRASYPRRRGVVRTWLVRRREQPAGAGTLTLPAPTPHHTAAA